MYDQHETESSLRATGHQPCLFLFLAVGSGILSDSYFSLTAAAWWLLAVGSLAGWILLWTLSFTRLASLLLLLAVSSTAGSWHHGYWHLYRHDHAARSVADNRRPICLRAEVTSEPRWVPAPPSDFMRTIPQGDSSRMDLKLLAARDSQQWQPVSGRASVTVGGHVLGLSSGDRIMLFAQVARPTAASGPGEFDFRLHLRGQRELLQLACNYPDCVQLEQPASPWRIDRLFEESRRRGVASLWRHVDREHAPLAAAMTLGFREQLDQATWDKFVETGSVHLLAISGLHVGILALGMFMIARLLVLSRATSLWLVIGVTMAYALLVELRPPVVRATSIIVVMCLARLSGRAPLSFNSLAAAGLVVLAMNPCDLYRLGPQFSFLAVAVLCLTAAWFAPRVPSDPLQRLIVNSRPWYRRKARQIRWHLFRLIGASTAIWLIAMPLALHHYNLCSPCAVIVYPLVTLPVSLAMLSGFGVLVWGTVFPPLAQPCGWLCSRSLSLIEQIVDTAHGIPGAYFWIAGPTLVLVVGFYASLGIYAALKRGQPSVRWPLVIALTWISCLTLGSAMAQRQAAERESVDCTFIDVGHGTSVLLELPGGKRLLYDAGSLGEPVSGMRSIAAALWQQGVTHLDAVVISHADADHYNALPGLLDKFTVGVVYVSPVMFERESPALQSLRESIERRGVAVREVYGGDQIGRHEQVQIEVLHPPRRGVLGEDNANSIVLDIAYQGQRILLPGDLESPGIDDVMAEQSPGYTVVMAPHHGSARSDPSGFAHWTQPQYVIISGGHGNDVSAVRQAYAELGARSLYTAADGAIRVEVNAEGVQVQSWHDRPW